MPRSVESGKARAVWFGVVDVMILLILAGFISSMFLMDGTDSGGEEGSSEKLVFSVTVQPPYGEALFLQEGGGNAVPIRLRDAEAVFGNLIRGDDGVFYVTCDLSAVEVSEDREGLWLLGDTVLMSGTLLSVSSELADFTVTVLSVPVKALAENVGTTEASAETSAVPESGENLEVDASLSEPEDGMDPEEASSDTEGAPEPEEATSG